MRITKRIWRAVEALESANPNIVSAPTSHVSTKRNIILVELMSNLIAVFLLIKCFSTVKFVSHVLDDDPNHYSIKLMTTLIKRMAKIGPRNVPKNIKVIH